MDIYIEKRGTSVHCTSHGVDMLYHAVVCKCSYGNDCMFVCLCDQLIISKSLQIAFCAHMKTWLTTCLTGVPGQS